MSAIQKLKTIQVSENFYNELKKLKSRLKDRKSEDFSIEDFMDYWLINSKNKYFDEYVELKTPMAYHLDSILNSDIGKKELEKFIQNFSTKKTKTVRADKHLMSSSENNAE